MQPTEFEIQGSDGVCLHARERGSGPPLVFVHGTAASAGRWGRVAELVSRHYRVVEYDRRGRGSSGDSEVYSLVHEVKDLACVLKELETGNGVDLVAHSYGALLALAGMPGLQSMLRHLVLYEAPLSIAGRASFINMDDVNELDGLLKQEGNEVATEFFLRRFPRATETEIRELKNSAGWAQRISAASTLGRELRAAHEFTIDTENMSESRVPCLILLGGASPEPFHISAHYLHEHMPGSILQVLDEQRHRAMDTIPDELAQKIENFLQT